MTEKKDDKKDLTIEDVLEKLSQQLLKEFVEGNDAKANKSSTKKKLVAQLVEIAEKKGRDVLLGALDKDAMREALLLVEKTDDLGHDSKTKMLKSMKQHLDETVFDKFLEKLDTSALDSFCKALEFKEEGNKEEKIDALCEELVIAGLRKMFDKMAKEFLSDVAKALQVSVSGTRKAIVDRVLGLAYPHLAEKEKGDKKKAKKEKGDFSDAPDVKDIKEGATMKDLYQYYAQQLQDWLKERGYKSSGSKKQLAKRIEGILKGDEKAMKDAQKMKPGERRKRKRGGMGRPAKGSKKSDEDDEDDEEEKEEKPAKKQKTA